MLCSCLLIVVWSATLAWEPFSWFYIVVPSNSNLIVINRKIGHKSYIMFYSCCLLMLVCQMLNNIGSFVLFLMTTHGPTQNTQGPFQLEEDFLISRWRPRTRMHAELVRLCERYNNVPIPRSHFHHYHHLPSLSPPLISSSRALTNSSRAKRASGITFAGCCCCHPTSTQLGTGRQRCCRIRSTRLVKGLLKLKDARLWMNVHSRRWNRQQRKSLWRFWYFHDQRK